jgi:ParB/RepB/Spo0J family partition protein
MAESKVVHLSSLSAPQVPLRTAIERGGIEELATSIRQVGLLQPLVVIQTELGYEVKAGHRRLLACRMAPLDLVPVQVISGDAEFQATVMLVENVLRQDLTPIEEARAIRGMQAVMGLSVAQIATRMSKSEAWVRGRIELLTWPDAAVEAVAQGRASVAALRPLMELEDVAERDRLIGCAIESGATAVVTRTWVAGVLGMAASMPEELSLRSLASMPLVEYVVKMPCFSCREERVALDLRLARICDSCIEEITHATAEAERAARAANGSGSAA